MKPKRIGKKLILKKQTVTNLEDRQQDAIRGGAIVASIFNTRCVISCNKPCPTQVQTVCGNTCCGSIDACSC